MFLSMVAQETILVSNSTAKPADSQIEFYMYVTGSVFSALHLVDSDPIYL